MYEDTTNIFQFCIWISTKGNCLIRNVLTLIAFALCSQMPHPHQHASLHRNWKKLTKEWSLKENIWRSIVELGKFCMQNFRRCPHHENLLCKMICKENLQRKLWCGWGFFDDGLTLVVLCRLYQNPQHNPFLVRISW